MNFKYFKLFVLFYLLGCNSNSITKLPYFISPDFTPQWVDNYPNQDTLHKIGDFSFINQNNEIINNNFIKDKIVVSNFFFTTCPSICPIMTSNLKRIQEKYEDKDEVRMISHSVTPWIDSVKILKNYEKLYNINPKIWQLVTGNKLDIYDLARKSNFAEEELGFRKENKEFLHTELVFLVDHKRHLRGVYNGTIILEIKRLLEDINLLINEKNRFNF